MKIGLVTNGSFITPKTEGIKSLLVEAFKSRGVEPICKLNTQLFADNLAYYDFDAVLFWDKDVTLASMLERRGVTVVNCAEAIETCDDKGRTMTVAAAAGLAVPHTIVAPFVYANMGYKNLDFLNDVTAKIDFPIVVKECHGSFGAQVYLAHNQSELAALVNKISPRPMLFQEYIECGSSDYRLQVVGGKVVAAVKRKSNGDFRANATLGGTMTSYDPTKAEIELAVEAAKAVKAEIAGVDILPGARPLLCEINANAHIKRITDATGVDVAGCIVDYVLAKL